jgi:hypothetical protein
MDKIAYPWLDPQLVFPGIPPYCSLLQHIAEMKLEKKKILVIKLSSHYKSMESIRVPYRKNA